MATKPRRAFPANEQSVHKAINAPALDGAGKLAPAGVGASGILEEDKVKKAEEVTTEEVTKYYVPVLKAVDDEQIVTGVVLQPEVVDAHGDIYDADVIRNASYRFMERYKGLGNTGTKLGLMHKKFKPQFVVLESYIAPQELVINSRAIKAGSWLMTVKVLDAAIWKLVKEGKLTGFSIGGKARVKKLAA